MKTDLQRLDERDREIQSSPPIPVGSALSKYTEKSRLSLRPQLTRYAANGDLQNLEALLENGVDVDQRSPNGSSALMIAAKYGQLNAVNMLLRYGAKTHNEALRVAQEAGHEAIVNCLSDP